MKKIIRVSFVVIVLFIAALFLVQGARLPIVGSDSGSWGTVLNNFLTAEHTQNGTHSNVTVSGNVGIGTTSPTTNLHVKGTLGIALSGLVNVTAGSTVVNTSDDLTSEISVGDAIKLINYSSDVEEIFTVSSITSTNITLDSASTYLFINATAYKDSSLFEIDDGDGTRKVIVDKSGNVGIGITTPTQTLHVFGGLNVSGNTGGNGLFVDSRGNVTILSNLTIGAPGIPGNITIYSPDGTPWHCGPDDFGTWNCTG